MTDSTEAPPNLGLVKKKDAMGQFEPVVQSIETSCVKLLP